MLAPFQPGSGGWVNQKSREKLLSEVSKSLPEGDDLQKSDEERVLLLL